MIWKEVTEVQSQLFQDLVDLGDPRLCHFSEEHKKEWETLFSCTISELQSAWSDQHQVSPKTNNQFSLFSEKDSIRPRSIHVKEIEKPEDLSFFYSYIWTNIGQFLAIHSTLGLHYLHFVDDEELALKNVQDYFGKYEISKGEMSHELQELLFSDNEISVYPLGTDFQRKIWQELTRIPNGEKWSYLTLAEKLGDKKAARAIGTAIGANPIAYLIPCHRVIQSSGKLAGFRWGLPRKNLLLNLERVSVQQNTHAI